jgi:hypothetical protein
MDLKAVYGILEVLTISEWGNWFSSKTNFLPWQFSFDWQVGLWWASLTFFSIINILIWWKTYLWFQKESPQWFPKDLSFVKTQLFLSAGYVFVCAFRSIVPRADVQKIVLWDTWFSSILVGRSVATIAELCLAGQLAFFLNYISKKYESPTVRMISLWIFPLLFLAEWFSWYSVLTTNYLGNTIEETLWCISGVLLAISSFVIVGKIYGKEKLIFLTMGFYSILYVIFMSTVDVPMYYNRFLNDSLQGKVYFTLSQGFHEINTSWQITHSYSDWEGELAWMFLYFTTAVWGSLGMIRAPFLLKTSQSIQSYQGILIQKVHNN